MTPAPTTTPATGPPPPTGPPSSTLPPPPPSPTRPPAEPVGSPRRLLGLAVLGGVALDIGLRGGLANLAVAIGLLTACAVVATSEHASRETRWLAGAAAVPACFLAVWTSPWLATANTLATVGLLVAAAVATRDASIFDLRPAQVVVRAFHGLGRAFARLGPLLAIVPRPRSAAMQQLARAARALLLALPMLVVLVALLAGSDAVFATLVTPDVDFGRATGHVVLAATFTAVLLLGGLAVGVEHEARPHDGRFGTVEVATMLGAAATVLALFVASQLVAMTSAGRRLVEEAGLTPAEYARSGFFELCWAAALVVTYLALVRWLADEEARESAVVRILAAAVPLLSTGLAIVALRRMALYDQAFGMTMLRLSVVAACTWIAGTLALIAARTLGVCERRSWVPGASAVLAWLLLMVGNAMNPEAFVVRHNIERADAGASLDTDYFHLLSDDAVAAIIEADVLPVDELAVVVGCRLRPEGIATANLAVRRAEALRQQHCA